MRWRSLIPSRLAVPLPAWLIFLGIFAALCASIVRTHLFCEATLIPNDGGGGLQKVLVLKRDLPRIFRPTP